MQQAGGSTWEIRQITQLIACPWVIAVKADRVPLYGRLPLLVSFSTGREITSLEMFSNRELREITVVLLCFYSSVWYLVEMTVCLAWEWDKFPLIQHFLASAVWRCSGREASQVIARRFPNGFRNSGWNAQLRWQSWPSRECRSKSPLSPRVFNSKGTPYIPGLGAKEDFGGELASAMSMRSMHLAVHFIWRILPSTLHVCFLANWTKIYLLWPA